MKKKFLYKISCFFIFLVIFSVKPAFSNNQINLREYKDTVNEIKNILINKHKVEAKYVDKVLSEIKVRKKTIDSMNNAAERKATWKRYKKIFITKKTINKGIKYHKDNLKLLKEIEKKYGVPSEVIVAILGVETKYGEGTGKIKVLDSLGTLAFFHPRRSKLFKSQLISFIVLTHKNNLNYNEIYGSYAGAMGTPQFMPESYIKYGVDYDKDGSVDLWNSKHDIYASVANYLVKKGWQKGQPIYKDIKIKKEYEEEIFKTGDVKTILVDDKYLKKILLSDKNIHDGKKYLALLSKKDKEYKLVYKNFKVIMTYNISTFYAMVVTNLSEKILFKK